MPHGPYILPTEWERKVCQQMDLGWLQEVLPMSQIETLLDTYQMWEQRERKLNRVVMVYWLPGLHLYPHLSQRGVYARLVSGLRAIGDDVPEAIPVKSAFSYRREQLGSEILQGLCAQSAGPQADEQTPGAFWRGMRLLGVDGTAESVAATPSNSSCLRYSTDDEQTHRPFPQARLVLVVECGTHLIGDAQISEGHHALGPVCLPGQGGGGALSRALAGGTGH
jgi:Insertion element 4 transposase N-terminal